MRASSYYRSAEFFLHGNQKDPRIAPAQIRRFAIKPGVAACDRL